MLNLKGTNGADNLVGGSAGDLIDGLGGNDTLLGGDGDDVFLLVAMKAMTGSVAEMVMISCSAHRDRIRAVPIRSN